MKSSHSVMSAFEFIVKVTFRDCLMVMGFPFSQVLSQ